jgi:hypothetical protein
MKYTKYVNLKYTNVFPINSYEKIHEIIEKKESYKDLNDFVNNLKIEIKNFEEEYSDMKFDWAFREGRYVEDEELMESYFQNVQKIKDDYL